MRVVLFANSDVGKFSLGSVQPSDNLTARITQPLYCLPVQTYPHDVVCTAVELEAYKKVDSTLTVWRLLKAPDIEEGEPALIGYGFYSRYNVTDFGNALLMHRRGVSYSADRPYKKRKKTEEVGPELRDTDLDRIASSAALIFRTDHFFVFGSPNYGVLITADSNDILDEALSNSI